MTRGSNPDSEPFIFWVTPDIDGPESSLPGPTIQQDDASLNHIQRTLRSMALRVVNGHVLPLGKQHRKLDHIQTRNIDYPSAPDDSILGDESRKKSSTDRSATSSKTVSYPFVSESFKLSFEVRPRLDLDRAKSYRSLTRGRIHRHGPYPTLNIGLLEYEIDPNTRLGRQSMAMEPLRLATPLSPPLSLRIKIPWKDKFISVRLPPV
jgi:hypothetical protein